MNDPNNKPTSRSGTGPPGPIDELTAYRLQEADGLVRNGARLIDNESVQIDLSPTDDGTVVVLIPLPPAPFTLSLQFPLGQLCGKQVEAESFCRTLKNLFAPVLPGSVTHGCDAKKGTIQWAPRTPELQWEAVRRLRCLGNRLTDTVKAMGDGLLADDALAQLNADLTPVVRRAEVLGRRFAEHAVYRLSAVGLVHLLAFRPGPRLDQPPRFLALQTAAELLATRPGLGVYVAMRLPESSFQPNDLAQRLCEVIADRFGVRFQPSDYFEVVGDWSDVDNTCLISSTARSEMVFHRWVDTLVDIVRFTVSYMDLCWNGHDPGQLLEGKTLSNKSAHPTQGPEGFDLRKAVAEIVPTAEQLAKAKTTPRGYHAKKGSPFPPDKAEIDRMSGTEVVRLLGAEEVTDVDVVMIHPGYNVEKTIKIMAIALNMDSEDARRICERTPCLLIGPVTRSRAAKVKTIVEGTGAQLKVVPTQGEPPQPQT